MEEQFGKVMCVVIVAIIIFLMGYMHAQVPPKQETGTSRQSEGRSRDKVQQGGSIFDPPKGTRDSQ